MVKKAISLKPADAIGVIVPSSPVKEPFRSNGLACLIELGWHPQEVADIFSNHGIVAKSAEKNLADLQSMLLNKSIKAIWAARGGYGSNYLLPQLSKIPSVEPKIIIGCSDFSYLLWHFQTQQNQVVFYGPMAYAAMAKNCFDQENLTAVLTKNSKGMKISGRTLLPGTGSGRIHGGCLSNLVSLIGTPYFPKLNNSILFLEDVSERPHRLDRMFWQLDQIHVFKNICGLMLGQFPNCFLDDSEKMNFYERLLELLKPYQVPVVADFPFGHTLEKQKTLPLGIKAVLNPENFSGIVFKESAVEL
jgi:muramoyltetrapeptide carboxypeptidase